MAEKKPAKASPQKAAPSRPRKSAQMFTPEEQAAMKERARELRAAASRAAKGEGEPDLLAKIAEMNDSDRAMAEKIHAVVKANAPQLLPKTWYGMPAYAKGGDTILFFRPAAKFKTRYATLGFSDKAKLDDGAMWPTDFALTKLTTADEKRIAALIKKAVG